MDWERAGQMASIGSFFVGFVILVITLWPTISSKREWFSKIGLLLVVIGVLSSGYFYYKALNVQRVIDSSRPQLIGYFDGQPRLASLPNEGESLLVFKVAVTNSGTPSIARDWRVYLWRPGVGTERLHTVVDPVPIEYLGPGKVVPTLVINPEEYIQNTTRVVIPTGHARFGLLVSKTKMLTTEAFSGASVIIRFRDVLDRDYELRRGLRVIRGQLVTQP